MSWIRHDPGPTADPAIAVTAERPGPRPGPPVDRGSTLVVPDGRFAAALATLDPGYFAVVMATGIVSIGTGLLGYQVLSQVFFVFTAAAFVVLAAAYILRAVRYPAFVRQNMMNPNTAVAYFTIVAGIDVLATRFAMGGHSLVTLGLGAAASLIWVAITYGLPWLVVAEARRPVLGEINGTWLIWVVATQSLAIIAAALAPVSPWAALGDALPAVAVCLWGVGVMLYIMLIAIIFLRLLVVEITPPEMGPAYWIAMGATAISVRSAAGILTLHGPGVDLVDTVRPFVVGFSVVLWAFGTWWIPLLVLFGIWRYVVRGYPRGYEPRLWSVVFPLGMYTVASYALGHAAPGLEFMTSIARVWVFVGLAAWVAVLVLMLAAFVRSFRHAPAASRAG